MFGTNIPIKPAYDDDGRLNIVSVFKTIQGEGPYSGQPAIFIRTAGCNLKCFFCDTDFETGKREVEVKHLTEEVATLAGSTVSLVVLTGGEPMAQNIVPLCEQLIEDGFVVQIETAGTVWPAGLANLCSSGAVVLVCSPKTPLVHKNVARFCEHYKYVVRHGEVGSDGLPVFSTQESGKPSVLYRPDPKRGTNATIWLSPMDEYLPGPDEGEMAALGDRPARRDEVAHFKNVKAVLASALGHGHRISLQTHKILGVA